MGSAGYLHSNSLHALGNYALASLGGLPDMTLGPSIGSRIPQYPWPYWDAHGHGIDRIGLGSLPFMYPGLGLGMMDPSVFRDGSFGRWQRRELWPAVMRGMYGGGYYGPYGGRRAMVPYGSYGRRRYTPFARRYPGYGVRGLGGRRYGLVGYGMRRPRMPPLHIHRTRRRGYPYSEDSIDDLIYDDLYDEEGPPFYESPWDDEEEYLDDMYL
jgi:hypothetical protein